MITTDSPLNSLRTGRWFKLICGASYQHLPSVRNLTLAYTLAGADCIDVAADPAVIAAAREGLAIADRFGEEARERGFGYRQPPWLMVSLNDGEDPHFRKAEFDTTACPPGCPRPCETICPAGAIAFSEVESGVIDRLCYGCGRCIPVCPADLIHARSYVFTPGAVAPLVFQTGADAIEIHTQIGREADFERLWNQIRPQVRRLKAIAVSCPDGPDIIGYLQTLYQILSPLPPDTTPIWQADGRPMSGDIGAGTTLAAVRLGRRILEARLPGYVQLAGGTNDYTVAKLRSQNLLPPSRLPTVAGVAYGSYARSLLSPLLDPAEFMSTHPGGMPNPRDLPTLSQLETHPDGLWKAVSLASTLVSQLKGVRGPCG